MSRTHAIVALTALVVVFVIVVLDEMAPPIGTFLPEALIKVVAAILIGVAIGLILNGLRRNGG